MRQISTENLLPSDNLDAHGLQESHSFDQEDRIDVLLQNDSNLSDNQEERSKPYISPNYILEKSLLESPTATKQVKKIPSIASQKEKHLFTKRNHIQQQTQSTLIPKDSNFDSPHITYISNQCPKNHTNSKQTLQSSEKNKLDKTISEIQSSISDMSSQGEFEINSVEKDTYSLMIKNQLPQSFKNLLDKIVSSNQKQSVNLQFSHNYLLNSEVLSSDLQARYTKAMIFIPKGNTVEGRVQRIKYMIPLCSPQFYMSLNEDRSQLIAAKKIGRNPSAIYRLTLQGKDWSKGAPDCLGKLKSNFSHTIYNLYSPGPNPQQARKLKIKARQILATIVYENEYQLLSSAKPRTFKVYIKKYAIDYQNLIGASLKEPSLAEIYSQNSDNIWIFQNRKPNWNYQKQIYRLNFQGKVRSPSVKNFILDSSASNYSSKYQSVMLFGKIDQDSFSINIAAPINAFLAFAIALTSFDTKH